MAELSFDPTGYTYAHEHLHIDLSGFKNNPDCRLDCYELLRDELRQLYALGVRNLVEVTNRYMGRNAPFMQRLMADTGIFVLPSTGYYQQAFYPPHVPQRSVDQLANEMIEEIRIGLDQTPLKARVIGEIGSSRGLITEDEKKVFQAAALAHLATGRPISTHTTLSTMGLEQLALLKRCGVEPEHIVIGHCDLKPNLDTVLALLDEGAWVQFDTIGKNDYFPDSERVAMLMELCRRGLLGRVMLSMDITRRSHLRANGGLGFSWLLTGFVPMLHEAGMDQRDVDRMLRDNPARFFN
ncbi:phosphotriesterase-related protein [Enterobacter sp. E76]|nr:phosphotriesterase-related protein [Enterobacter sp. E76]